MVIPQQSEKYSELTHKNKVNILQVLYIMNAYPKKS